MVELRLVCGEPQVEPLCELLDDAGALSVSVEDADAGSEAEQALFGEPGLPPPRPGWTASRVAALFGAESTAQQAALRVAAELDGIRVLAIDTVPEADWVRLTQSQFEPVAIAPGFWIVPSWHEVPADARTVIRLDPGLAFGTGTHPTTRMCLRWIARQGCAAQRVLDYGCGSGILAIAAALHGAAAVDAVDIDPAAVQATQDNARANGVALASGTPEHAAGRYHTVLANILATPLKLLAPLLCGHVAPGGHLVLAGILARQAGELTAAYAPWLVLSVADEEDGWVLMTATAPA